MKESGAIPIIMFSINSNSNSKDHANQKIENTQSQECYIKLLMPKEIKKFSKIGKTTDIGNHKKTEEDNEKNKEKKTKRNTECVNESQLGYITFFWKHHIVLFVNITFFK